MELNWTCDFCSKRKRRCDGLALRHCSFCASKNRAECHYSRRRAPSRTSATSTSRPALSSSSSDRKPGHDDDGVTGRSFWRTDLDSIPAPSKGRRLAAAASSVASGARESGLVLPLKRGRFSASPATGLIGLQENQFLSDFFRCLGFVGLTNQSTVREAMVRIMLTHESPRCPRRHRHRGAPSPFQRSPICYQGQEEDKHGGLVGEGNGDTRQSAFCERSTNVGGSCWSNALVGERGIQALPRDSSTCTLWCAIALGALVRGHPLAHVGRYVDLAEDSLRACRDPTLDTARAHVAMAVLHDFLGHPVTTHDYLKIASSLVDQLPPEHIPRGFHGLLQYAKMSWTLETELASAEDVQGYWENASPIWELSENVSEQDICGLVLSTCVRMKQHFVDVTGVNRVVFAEEQQPRPSAQASLPFIESAERQDSDVSAEEISDSSSAETKKIEVHQIEVVASTEIPSSVLPEMLRVQEYFESSNDHQGVGGLLYYTELTYLQGLNGQDTTSSFSRSIDAMLRYPGLCRYKSWLWIAHSHLFILAFSHQRYRYEEVRASYNAVRPAGSLAVPAFEDFRGVSDICDHPWCRRSAERAQLAIHAKLAHQLAP